MNPLEKQVNVGELNPNYKHGMSNNTNEYRAWLSMMRHCYNMNSISYRWLGSKGITVAEAWHDFKNFFDDMGFRPHGLCLRRVNSKSDYSKENCYWGEMPINRDAPNNDKYVLGKEFGSWMVLGQKKHPKYFGRYYECQCVCGTIKLISGTNLLHGHTNKCRKCSEEIMHLNFGSIK